MFRKTIETAIIIQAAPETVWNVVGALEQYAGWNTATTFTTAARVGKWQIMTVKLGRLWLPVPVLIQHCNRLQGLRWIGGIPGIITGSHYFRVENHGNNNTRMVQGEDFSGLLVPLLLPLLGGILDALYNSVNADTKARCEAEAGN